MIVFSCDPGMITVWLQGNPSGKRVRGTRCTSWFHAVGLRVPQTLERFELWVRAEISTYPVRLLAILLSLARRARRGKETHQFILVQASLRCNTLLQRFGGVPQRAEDELVQWMN